MNKRFSSQKKYVSTHNTEKIDRYIEFMLHIVLLFTPEDWWLGWTAAFSPVLTTNTQKKNSNRAPSTTEEYIDKICMSILFSTLFNYSLTKKVQVKLRYLDKTFRMQSDVVYSFINFKPIHWYKCQKGLPTHYLEFLSNILLNLHAV